MADVMAGGRSWAPRLARTRLIEMFATDLRSLALFRIGLAVVLIADLITRAADLGAHYTDWGVLPREALLAEYGRSSYLSLHFWTSGSAAAQGALLIVAGVVALLLLLGYRTWLMTLLSWALLVSLQKRNPLVMHGGDHTIRLLLFWSLFLPLGARFSLDAARDPRVWRIANRFVSAGVVAIFLQVCFIYWFAGIAKLQSPEWRSGEALFWILHQDLHARPLGIWLREHTTILNLATWGTIAIELFGPVLVFSPVMRGPLRVLAVLLFIGLHAGFGLGVNLGVFPFMSMVAWLPFVPTWLWERMSSSRWRARREAVRVYYDGECGFCMRMIRVLQVFTGLPEHPPDVVRPAQDDPAMLAVMKERNSWIVIDHKGQRRFKFDAFAYVLRLSPLTWWKGAVLSWRPLMWIGTRMYQWVALHRTLLARLTAFLSERPLRVQPSRAGSVMAIVLIVYVLVWNVRNLGLPEVTRLIPNQVLAAGRALRLNQSWAVFTDITRDDGWFVITGETMSGRQVGLFPASDDDSISWAKPAVVSATFGGQRWARYMIGIRYENRPALWCDFAAYHCRRWSERYPNEDRLERIVIGFMTERMTEFGLPLPGRRRVLHEHECGTSCR